MVAFGNHRLPQNSPAARRHRNSFCFEVRQRGLDGLAGFGN